MGELKYVTYKHLKKGQKVEGAKSGGSSHGFTGYVKEANAAYVIIEMWKPGGREEKYSSELMFGIEMTEEEFKGKYNEDAGKIVKAIQNTMHSDEIGYKEMWNAWLSYDPWEMAQECRKNKLTVLGHCKDIIPKIAMFSGDTLDVGICVEDEDGDRFWCHFRSSDIEIMRRRYEKYQELMKKGKTGEYSEADILIEYMEERERQNAD